MTRIQSMLTAMVRKASFTSYALVAVTLALVATLVVGSSGATAAPAEQAGATDLAKAQRYSLTIDGFEIASFTELVSMTSEVLPVDFVESTDREIVFKKLPGELKPTTVALRRPITTSLELWAWNDTVRQGNIVAARKSVSLTMLNGQNRPIARFMLEKAWPTKLGVDTPVNAAKDALYETVVLVCERLYRMAP